MPSKHTQRTLHGNEGGAGACSVAQNLFAGLEGGAPVNARRDAENERCSATATAGMPNTSAPRPPCVPRRGLLVACLARAMLLPRCVQVDTPQPQCKTFDGDEDRAS